jgi:HK97 family phage prohead protease
MSLEFKGLSLSLKAEGDAGEITGYGAVFVNKDSYGDVIEPGAFKGSIGRRKVKMLWQHDMAQPIGVWDEVAEDDSGLRVKGRISLKTAKGAEAAELVRMGAIDGLSIGFRSIKDMMDGAVRKLQEIELYEISLVTMPANPLATVTGIKGNMTVRGFEEELRRMGFSRWDSKVIIAEGFRAWADRRDAEPEPGADQRDAEAIKAQLQQLLAKVNP